MEYLFQNNKSIIKIGDLLKTKLNTFNGKFILVSAFAKCSGVLRLKNSMTSFLEHGGQIKTILGCDSKGTTYEACANLLNISNEMYIVHNNSNAITFHPKIYIFYNDIEAWIYIGSSNLTAGGLWTNTEAGFINELDLSKEEDNILLNNLLVSINSTITSQEAMQINSIEDLNVLSIIGLLPNEIETKIRGGQTGDNQNNNNNPFPTSSPIQPALQHENENTIPANRDNNETNPDEHNSEPNDTESKLETLWFQYGPGTGGSRNILDLSKVGTLISGNAPSAYALPNNKVKGGVTFFDIDPQDTDIEKDIIINYKGLDYMHNTIKYPTGPNANGSWRLQLKGIANDHFKLSTHAIPDFINNILVFTKVSTDYYLLTTFNNNDLLKLEQNSKFVATNGKSAAASRKFGLF